MRHSARAVVGLAAAGGLAVPFALAGPVHASTSSWVATATQAEPTGGLTLAGPLAATAPLHLAVGLDLRNSAALAADVAGRQVLSPAAFRASFAPTSASVAAVVSYLRSSGFTAVTSSPDGLVVTGDAPASVAASAFHTTLDAFTLAGRSVFANVTAASVPSGLAGTVASVIGLNDLATVHTAVNPSSSCLGSALTFPCTYEPQGFVKAYDATTASTGAGAAVAIFAEGDLTGVVKDLRQEEAANGLAQVPVQIVPTGAASSDTSGSDEWDLDTQYSTGMAGTVSDLVVYDAPSLSDPDLTTAFDAFATQGTVRAASASFGGCEFASYLDGSMATDDAIFEEAAATGHTVFASSGDTGGFCPYPTAVNGVPAGVPGVSYPASSPYVVAVGGTTLLTGADGSYSTEAAWYSGGGGPSLFERAGGWQAGDGLTGALGQRTLPDVSMDADSNTGADVVVSGTPTGVGGTSLSSPLALGVWARLETASGGRLGFASPLLYAASGSGAFHDITLGAAVPYPALPGYDLATGLGTFDVAKAQAAIG